MSFISEINLLTSELDKISTTDVELKQFIEKCRAFASTFLASDSKPFIQLKNISTEPKGSYFPEMYSKEKGQALVDCKKELVDFLKNSTDEFNSLIIDKPFEEIIKHEESQCLEFKSTLCWDVNSSKVDKKIMGEIIMKSISALSNSEGGVLLIGIRDDKVVLGLYDDYKTFKNGSGNRDHFELHLTTLIINNFSKTFAKDNLSIEFPKIGKKEICLIRIKKSSSPLTVKITDKSGQAKEKFFIRVNNSSRDIDDLIEFARYIKKRFPKWN
jgi:hypothetical protein